MGLISDTAMKDRIKEAVGSSSARTIFATFAFLYVAKPDPNRWTPFKFGAVALVKDLAKDAFFIRLVDMESYEVLWGQQVDKEFVYRQDTEFFHSFPGDDCVTGLFFQDEGDAAIFFEKVQNRETLVNNRSSYYLPSSTPPVSVPTVSVTGTVKKSDRKLTKADIGLPTNFRHLSHIGWHPETGFDIQNIPEDWKALFDRAGVTREQLEDKETAQYIVDFIDWWPDRDRLPPPKVSSANFRRKERKERRETRDPAPSSPTAEKVKAAAKPPLLEDQASSSTGTAAPAHVKNWRTPDVVSWLEKKEQNQLSAIAQEQGWDGMILLALDTARRREKPEPYKDGCSDIGVTKPVLQMKLQGILIDLFEQGAQ